MTLTCLIPAYNEAARIGAVLSVVLNHPEIDEVLVIDDGSSDGTAEVARGLGATCLALRPNRGKTAALAEGIRTARGEMVMLIDADLVGLTRADLSALIAPVRAGLAPMSISLRGNAPGAWKAIGLDYISGERVIRRDLLEAAAADLDRLPAFGFEVHLNRHLLRTGKPLAVADWPAVRNSLKIAKHGLWKGLAGDARMIVDLLRTCGPAVLLSQIVTMRRRILPNLHRPATG